MLGLGFGLNRGRRIGGFVGLLDRFPDAAAAYSLRKLRKAYTGAAVRVRESGGNTEADIGFLADGTLDTTALLAHCGANDGFVTVWYDQSGNGNNAVNTTLTEQPLIVSGGVIVEENGKAAIQFDGSVVNKKLTFTYAASTPISSFIVMREIGTNSFPYVLGASNGSLNDILCLGFIKSSNVVRNFISGINQFVDANYTDYSLYTSIMDAANSVIGRNGGSGVATNNATGTSGLTTFSIGAQPNDLLTAAVDGTMQEIIIFDSNQSINRTGIEGNINTYYNIY